MGKHAQESYVSTNFLTQANASSTYAPLASPTFTGTVTVPAPVNATDAVTKQYADAIVEGLHIHAAVGAATTTNINIASPPATIDGVTLVDTMRVLVKDQNTTSENGIYVYNSASSSLTRALDFDTPAETDGGDFVFVTGGNTYDNTGWVQTETVTTIGTSPILFTQFSGAGTYTAGAGLFLNGTEFSNTGVLSLTGTANEVEVSASAGSITISLPSTINADTTGSAASLTTSRVIELSGDVSGSASFNGSGNASISSTLADTAVTPATYGSASAVATVTVDSKGRVTSASNTPVAIDQSAVTNLTTDLAAKAPLASPALTGTPTAPTAALGTNTTQIATTEFVESRFDTTTINTRTASYGLVLADAGKTIEMNVASANNLTVPMNSSQAFPIGTTIDVIQYGSGQTTIVAGQGSPDNQNTGITWTSRTSNLGNTSASEVAYGNGLWVAVGYNGGVRTSTDTATWTTRTSNFPASLSGSIFTVAYGNGMWVAAARDANVRKSTDGITWTTVSSASFGLGQRIFAINYANNIWLIAGRYGDIRRSTDTVTWTTVTSNFTASILDIGYGNDLWIAAGYNGEMRTSTDSLTWTTVASNFPADSITRVVYGNGLWVAGGYSGNIRTSTNGSTWTTVTSNFGTTNIYSLSYSNSLWISGGDNGHIRKSTDGSTWTTVTSNFGTTTVRSISYGNDMWVALGRYNSMATSPQIYYSPTIRSKESKLKLTSQYSGATLYKRGTDEWVVVGDLTT